MGEAEQHRPTAADVRSQVERWIEDNWNDEITVRDWWRRLADAGYSSPGLSPDVGGLGWPGDLAATVMATLTKARVLGPPAGLGLLLAAPTIATLGRPDQIERYLRPILDGTEGWCQLFSEPQAGSDLAGLQTRAEPDGDEWIVTGQKVWSSTAKTADLAMLLARTDPDAPKRKGITYFVMEMDQPGVDVRPLREMTGRAVFNEVFLDEARVRRVDIVGELNEGWRVANATLAFERAGVGHGGAAFAAARPGGRAGDLDRPAASFVGASGPISGAAVGRRHLKALMDLAAERGRISDPLVRQAIVRRPIRLRPDAADGLEGQGRADHQDRGRGQHRQDLQLPGGGQRQGCGQPGSRSRGPTHRIRRRSRDVPGDDAVLAGPADLCRQRSDPAQRDRRA